MAWAAWASIAAEAKDRSRSQRALTEVAAAARTIFFRRKQEKFHSLLRFRPRSLQCPGLTRRCLWLVSISIRHSGETCLSETLVIRDPHLTPNRMARERAEPSVRATVLDLAKARGRDSGREAKE